MLPLFFFFQTSKFRMNFNSTDSRAFLSGTFFSMYEVVRVSGLISCLRFACLLAPRNTKGKVKLTVSRVFNGKGS